jgi:hypothetical protein
MKVLDKMKGYFRIEFIEATKHVDILAHAVDGGN